jgi:hypothetical protein
MSPGDCAVYNATHWAYMVNTTTDPNYACCTALNSWKDPIGDVCIYDIMGQYEASLPLPLPLSVSLALSLPSLLRIA